MDNRVIEGRKMYHLDEKQIQEITDYIFLEDKLEKADAIFIPGCARPEHTEEAARLYKDGYEIQRTKGQRYTYGLLSGHEYERRIHSLL